METSLGEVKDLFLSNRESNRLTRTKYIIIAHHCSKIKKINIILLVNSYDPN